MFKHKIYFSREKNGLGCLNARAFISRAVRAALEVEGITEPCEVSVLLTDDEMNKKSTCGTVSYMPAVFGCYLAEYVIKRL